MSRATAFHIQDGICAQRRLRSACVSAQSDESLRCTLEDDLHLWLPTVTCEDRSDQTMQMGRLIHESSLGSHAML